MEKPKPTAETEREQALRRRRNQVRDALQRCKNLQIIEEIAKILGL